MSRRVLAVGAHPDDIELGCGATLRAHVLAGDHVTMLVLTGGQNGPGDIRGRHLEQEQAAAVLGADLRWGNLLDCTLTPDASLVAVVEAALVDTGADVVYVHAPEDSHQDHRAAAAAVLSAARRRGRILHYQSPSTTSFTPTVFVDVAATLDAKLEALACHASQVDQSAMVELDAVAASARHYGAMARAKFAEAFSPTRFIWDLAPSRPAQLAQHSVTASVTAAVTATGSAGQTTADTVQSGTVLDSWSLERLEQLTEQDASTRPAS